MRTLEYFELDGPSEVAVARTGSELHLWRGGHLAFTPPEP